MLRLYVRVYDINLYDVYTIATITTRMNVVDQFVLIAAVRSLHIFILHGQQKKVKINVNYLKALCNNLTAPIALLLANTCVKTQDRKHGHEENEDMWKLMWK